MAFPQLYLLNPGDILKITFRAFYNGQLALNVYWYLIDPAGMVEDYEPALQDWFAVAFPTYQVVTTSSVQLVDATMRVYTTAGQPLTPTLFIAVAPKVGSVSGNTLPSQTCGIITRRALATGNKNRGRIYVPFPSSVFLGTDEHPTAAYITLLDGISNSLMNTTVGYVTGMANVWQPILFNPGVTPFRNLLETKSEKKWGTQRRRGDYGIPNVYPA